MWEEFIVINNHKLCFSFSHLDKYPGLKMNIFLLIRFKKMSSVEWFSNFVQNDDTIFYNNSKVLMCGQDANDIK